MLRPNIIKKNHPKMKDIPPIGVTFPVELIQESIEVIRDSGIQHEFRTTVVRPFCELKDACKISSLLEEDKTYRVQAFQRTPKMINPNIQKVNQYSDEVIASWK